MASYRVQKSHMQTITVFEGWEKIVDWGRENLQLPSWMWLYLNVLNWIWQCEQQHCDICEIISAWCQAHLDSSLLSIIRKVFLCVCVFSVSALTNMINCICLKVSLNTYKYHIHHLHWSLANLVPLLSSIYKEVLMKGRVGADPSALMCQKSKGNEDALAHFMGSIQKHKHGTIKTHIDICTHLILSLSQHCGFNFCLAEGN